MSLPIEKSLSDELAREVARRRTFAIISHPDAGKTTLTEKLLLYAGAVHLAGAVHARSHQRASKSDWMELEQARGISITSTALQFDYEGVRVNLLDTPGHQDFSEDTYRTLMAVEHRRPARGVVHHTDRGSQYAATRYRELLARHGLTASMSRRGNCWDNAVVESFFHTLKTEHVHHQRYRTREEARQDIFEWAEVFYNRVRRHSTLGYRSPAEFEAMATGS